MLQGKKTSLRPLEETDLEVLQAWYNDQEVNFWANAAWPLSTMFNKDALAERIFQSGEAGAGLKDEYRYAILTDDKKMIGYTGFRQMNIPARSATLFITIGDKAYWSRGYGSDALFTLAQYLFRQWNFYRLQLDTWDGNVRALKAYQKVGFRIEGRLREARYVLGQYRDAVLLGMLQKDFFADHPDLAAGGIPGEQNS
ncbi:Gcn5-related N-acetyltransferase (GNAT) domain protein [Acididesulfobacillus acetoxydans]|uniref:Acetyltransferase, ribosomal protein N-acetylase n=1 Tax=Acididesulfobacillus acetoxydans TaxID=1561005 RepID=A0A8S0XC02_9FIRM|nr:GNAT family protein [Acididesulfobacillus acetoxydans]CAA7601836.1 Gcn5-related N-acetyltransferase (GNAT) domain protein [Acididesulfobacillus acetoxydans]CEJ06857.1 Acetyltransferase, ribosomal protein N-acetylase [Acididesulfobacillus acetoxydans]